MITELFPEEDEVIEIDLGGLSFSFGFKLEFLNILNLFLPEQYSNDISDNNLHKARTNDILRKLFDFSI